jgi:hypothetical protein
MSESNHVHRTRECVREKLGCSRPAAQAHHSPDEYSGDHTLGDLPGTKPAELGTRLSTVKPERVEWLWPGRIPRGKLTLVDGDPGLGKSVLTMDLAARVSSGQPMPGEERQAGEDREPAGVVLLTAEDGLADTVVPRLQAAGADLERILALEAVPETLPRPPRLPDDSDWIAQSVQQVSAALVIIDPLMAFLSGKVNSHRDQDCRLALHPLAKMAEKTGAAVVVIRHLNKATGGSPLYRGGGSIGIIGAARSGLLVARDPDDPERRVLASLKCNLAKLPPSLAYSISPADNGAIRVGWVGESAHTAASLLAVPQSDEDKGAVQDAVEVLRSIISSGQRPADEVKREARNAGVSERTLYRAKSVLGVCSRLVGFGADGKWYWGLPDLLQSARGCQT